MKNTKLKKRDFILPFSKKENGSGALNYTWYFIAIIICIVIFAFNKFHMGLYVVEEIVENGLHIAESGAVAVNMTEDNFLTKVHMIPSADTAYMEGNLNSFSSDGKEEEEVRKVANAFSTRLIEQLKLNDNANPTIGTLAEYCGTDSKVSIISCRLIEPVYEIVVTRHEIPEEENPEPEEPENPDESEETEPTEDDKEFIDNDYDFTVEYVIQGWKEYPIYFINNHFSNIGTPQFTTTPPVLKNGNQIEGATIEATVELSFNGVKNIFASTGESGIFTKNPTSQHYVVNVTQAFDIVTVDNDSRN